MATYQDIRADLDTTAILLSEFNKKMQVRINEYTRMKRALMLIARGDGLPAKLANHVLKTLESNDISENS